MTQQSYQYQRNGYVIDTDQQRLDLNAIHAFLKHSYWSPGLPRDVMERAIENSFCFGLYQDDQQIGFARIITDYAHFAYLCDVFVLKPYRGKGLGKWLVECVVNCELLQGLRAFRLGTRDAHELYQQYGFQALENPEYGMEIKNRPSWLRPELVEE
ncbi:GNAT family N-acetyltransferase [Candidatus Sumerlaeota bacterium]|nr:GNAT family N-acetyltransferase [Candidatus Sumerlaeota bacterium]